MLKTTILFLLLTSVMVFSQQEETLIDLGEIEHGGYGALVIKSSSFQDHYGMLMGVYGGWLIDHQFMIGLGGYGLVTPIEARAEAQVIEDKTLYTNFGYGGFMMEYTGMNNKLIHYNIRALIGGGGVTFSLKDSYDLQDAKESACFVAELDAHVELNVVDYFRIALGAGYRYASGIDIAGVSDEDLRAVNYEITFKFGRF